MDSDSTEQAAPSEGVLRKLGASKLAAEVGKTMAVEMFFARQQGNGEAESHADDFDGGETDGDGE